LAVSVPQASNGSCKTGRASNGDRDPIAVEALIRCCGGSTPELDALPDRIGDRVAPTADMQEAAE
jgi:hypothetical protein